MRARQHKRREVPLHETTTVALREYAGLRDRRWQKPITSAFFLGVRGGRLSGISIYRTFPALIRQVGLEGKGTRLWPRPHDLRHTLAVGTLMD